jgi:hypothetical protein
MSTRPPSWPVTVAPGPLSATLVRAGTLRLIQLAGGPAVLPARDRFAGMPLPLVLHIGATRYALTGILQFHQRFRRRHLDWHRRAGRVLAVAGLLVAISALSMNRGYAIGLEASTQGFTGGIGEAIFSTGVIAADLAKGAGWLVNLAIAERAFRRPARLRRAVRISPRSSAAFS